MKWDRLAILAALAVAAGAMLSRTRSPLARAAGALQGVAETAYPPTPVERSAGFVMRVFDDAGKDRLFTVAASVGFYALLSIVPTLAAAVSLFGLFADPKLLAESPAALSRILPAEAISLVQNEAQRLTAQPAQTLSLKLAFALSLSLWSASAAVRALFDALNVIEGVDETRGIFSRYATALAVTLGGVVLMSLAVTTIGADPKWLDLGPFTQQSLWLYRLARWPMLFCIGVAAIALLYRIGPSVRPASYRRLLPGASLAAFVWALGSSGFGWYAARLGNYTATYGSLATVAILMTWLWLSAAIVLLGAQVNHECNRGRI